MADIEQMFHQIQVKQADRDALRFVWRNQPVEKIQDYVMNVHLFGEVDSPCCANWALKKSASDQKDQYDEKVVKSVNLDFYMDDFLNSQPTKKELINLSLKNDQIISSCKFQTNKVDIK